MSIKSIILKKGWAGKTISRPETATRVNALIRPLIELLHSYNAFVAVSPESDTSDIQTFMPTLRADIGKLAETVHSCGQTAYSGVVLEQDSFSESSSTLADVAGREKEYRELLSTEGKIEHQMRTRAIIDVVAANSEARYQIINGR